jgi:lipoyl(octanoyl) transferase
MLLEVRRPGRVDFDEAWALQRGLAAQAGPERGFLLLLEHPPVITVGRNGDLANVVDAGDVPVKRIDRGGDVTVHGPGQLVGYPIVDVRRLGVRRFVRAVEESLLALLAELGVEARRKADCVGVWAAGGKIASIGVRVSRGISTHGFALNVGPDLSLFDRIHPCGVPGCAMTSVSRELGREVGVDEAASRFRLLLPGVRVQS